LLHRPCLGGLQAEYLDASTGASLEDHPGVHHTRVIENEQGIARQLLGQIAEMAVPYRAFGVGEQLAGIAFRQRLLRDPFIGQCILHRCH
jgi:hypothetical protein